MIHCLLGLELMGFFYIYVCGSRGIAELMKLRAENNLFVQELKDMHVAYETVQQEVNLWKHDDFVREQMARKRLQMAREKEEIYYLTSR